MSPLAFEVPLEPSASEARRLLLDELGKQAYRDAQPTLFDRAAQWFFDWLQGLFSSTGGPAPVLLLTVGLVFVAVLVVVTLLVFGLPRARARAASRGTALFGADDRRSAAELRAAARAAAAAGDFRLAVVEGFRAIARSADERTLVTVTPGTTADAFAAALGGMLPGLRADAAAAAATFDRVRYADEQADANDWAALERLDAALAASRPALAVPAS